MDSMSLLAFGHQNKGFLLEAYAWYWLLTAIKRMIIFENTRII